LHVAESLDPKRPIDGVCAAACLSQFGQLRTVRSIARSSVKQPFRIDRIIAPFDAYIAAHALYRVNVRSPDFQVKAPPFWLRDPVWLVMYFPVKESFAPQKE
jgi:hypothetical protein